MIEGQLGKLDLAAAQFRAAIASNPRFAPAHMMLGVTLRRQGDHTGALAELRKAVAINPKDPDAQYNLGMELKSGGDLPGAIAAFQRAIEVEARFRKRPL